MSAITDMKAKSPDDPDDMFYKSSCCCSWGRKIESIQKDNEKFMSETEDAIKVLPTRTKLKTVQDFQDIIIQIQEKK